MRIKCTDFYGKVHLVDSANLIDRVSAYGVFVSDGKILMIQDPRSMRWEFPGGGIEKDETIRQGLSREFIEEAGVTISGTLKLLTEWKEYFFDVTSGEPWRSKRMFYIVQKIEGDLLASGNSDDSAAAKLFTSKQTAHLSLSPQIRNIIEQLNNIALV